MDSLLSAGWIDDRNVWRLHLPERELDRKGSSCFHFYYAFYVGIFPAGVIADRCIHFAVSGTWISSGLCDDPYAGKMLHDDYGGTCVGTAGYSADGNAEPVVVAGCHIVHTPAHAAEIDGYADGSGMGTFFGVSFLYRDCIDRAACQFWNTAYESTEEYLTGNLVRTDRDEYSGLLSDQLDFGKGDALARGSGFYGACQK